jgi:photosystem II stability/assembly factor-like uncharacterized protein
MLKRSLTIFRFAFVALATSLLGTAQAQIHQPTFATQNSQTQQTLISVSPVNSQIVWASGTGGTWLLTTDGGQTWRHGVVQGTQNLQFRDVQGVSDKIAYLQSIGNNPGDFRIFKTTDGGVTWNQQFQNRTVNAFYDCFAFWTPTRGISHSDSVIGVFPDIRTTDGKHWESIKNNMPPALPGEFSFAASGTCTATQGDMNAWIVTGGGSAARDLVTRDGGNTWNAYDTPLISSGSAGAFTVAFRDPLNGIVAGGDLNPNNPYNARTATSNDGGITWTLTNPPPVTGAIFGLGYVSGAGLGLGGKSANEAASATTDFSRAVVVTAETGGAAWTPDEGTTWFKLPSVSGYWAVAFSDPHNGWMVGLNGQILKISF